MSTQVNYKAILNRLLATWALCFGVITLLDLAGFWLPHIWLPLLGVGLCIPLSYHNRKHLTRRDAHCPHMASYTMYTLVLSAIVILIFDLADPRIWGISLAASNMRYYIPSLIIYPVATAVFGVALLRRSHSVHCHICRTHAGYTMRETLEHNVFHAEIKRMLWLIFILCAVISALVWLYFIFLYADFSFSRADSMAFIVVPCAAYALSVLYMAGRVSNMQFEIAIAPRVFSSDIYTMARFIVIKDDSIILSQLSSGGIGTNLWDTPYSKSMSYTEEYSDSKAESDFTRLSGVRDFTLRRLFVSNTASHNAFHFAVVLPPGSDYALPENAQPMGIFEISQLLRSGHVTRPFALEINRIYTVTMAWKTYTREGKRLYPIKNYHPTFRIADFKDWKVDYGDPIWLDVAAHNEDKPFFSFHRFLRKHLTGSSK